VKQLYVLVGVPASGKSTWIKNQDWALGLNIVSTDVWVEDYANRMGKTYSDVFDEYMPIAVKLMADHAVKCRENNHDIIWDQTSTTVLSRAKKIRMLPDYYKIAVVFKTPPMEELKARLASRAGKVVPMEVVESMITNWEEPTKEEGFDEIWYN
jgi:predicted kinase